MPADSVTSVDLTSMIKPFTADALANGFATLVGALLGVMLAYWLQQKHLQAQERKIDKVSAHRLMFSLLQQVNTIVLIQRDFVYEKLSDPGRFLSIPASAPLDTAKNVLGQFELSFLLQDRDGRQVLYDFYLAQENYVAALNQWNLRSMFHRERLQPAFAASGIQNGSKVTNVEMRQALGDEIYFHAISATDGAISTLQRAFQKLTAIKGQTRAYIVKRFESEDFTDFDFPDTWGLVSVPTENL